MNRFFSREVNRVSGLPWLLFPVRSMRTSSRPAGTGTWTTTPSWSDRRRSTTCLSQVGGQGSGVRLVRLIRVSSSVHGIKYTPLGISIVFNHEIIAHKLLDHPDIDVNKATCESTALHYACLRNSVALIEAICTKVIIRNQEPGHSSSWC